MAATGIQKVSYNHEAMINWLIENPHRSQRDAALYFDVSETWLSQVVNSDAFKMKLHQRQEEVFSIIAHGVPEKLRGVASIAIDKLGEKLAVTEDKDFLMNATDKLLHRMGFAPQGQRTPAPPNGGHTVNNTLVVQAGTLDEARALMKGTGLPVPEEKVVAESKG